MSTYPSLEGRVSAQEHRQTILDARIEDVSRDMTKHMKELADNLQHGFNDLAKYQIATEQQIDTKFSQIDARLDKIEARLDNVDARLDKIETRLDKMEQSFTARFTTIEIALAQILARLPETP